MPASTPAVTALAASANIAPKEMGGRYDLKAHCVSPAGRSRPPIGLSSAIGQSASSSRWICSAVARYAFARGLRILIESNGNATSSRNPGSSSAENITPSTQAHVLDQDPVSAAETIDRDYPAPR
jgi:hypothetical protein